MTDEEGLSRLLRKRPSSDKFRLFKVIATSPQSKMAASDAVRNVFQGSKWEYLDGLRSLTSKTLWSKSLLTLCDCGSTVQLTEYGFLLWKLVQPLLVSVKQKEWLEK